jgi:hypothetical protein
MLQRDAFLAALLQQFADAADQIEGRRQKGLSNP